MELTRINNNTPKKIDDVIPEVVDDISRRNVSPFIEANMQASDLKDIKSNHILSL